MRTPDQEALIQQAIAQGPITEAYQAEPRQVVQELNRLRATEITSFLQYKQHGFVNLLPVDLLIGQGGGGSLLVALPMRPRALSLLASSGSVESSLLDRPGRREGDVAGGSVARWVHTRRGTVARVPET
jgi:hypothetical protein